MDLADVQPALFQTGLIWDPLDAISTLPSPWIRLEEIEMCAASFCCCCSRSLAPGIIPMCRWFPADLLLVLIWTWLCLIPTITARRMQLTETEKLRQLLPLLCPILGTLALADLTAEAEKVHQAARELATSTRGNPFLQQPEQ